MRSVLLAMVFFSVLPGVIIRPEVGVMLWAWLAYMTPQKMTYDFTRNLPLTQFVALVTLVAWAISPRLKMLRLDGTVLLFLALLAWFGVTTWVAVDHPGSLPLLMEELKKFLLVVLGLILIDSRRKLLWLVGVIAVSLGFFGVQGGLFVLATAGSRLVEGPAGSYAQDNNGLAVVMVMSLPLICYFYLQAERTATRSLLALAMVLTVISILGTHSRGGFLALSGCLGFLWLKTQRSLLGIVVLLAMLGIGLLAMPESFYNRLDTLTLQRSEMDKSALGRLEAWEHALNITAARPLVGAGFTAFEPNVFYRFTPDYQPRAAHSIFFQVLGEHGIVGFVLYFGLLYAGYRNGGWLVEHARGRPEAQWAGRLGRMLQVCVIGFVIGGAFLSLARIEPIYGIVMVSAIARRVARAEARQEEESGISGGVPSAAPGRPSAG